MNEKIIQFYDKLLPDQPEHNYLYKGNNIHKSIFESICIASGIKSPHEEFKLEYTDKFTVEEMASNPASMQFLGFLTKIIGAKRVLEIGTFIGVSAMYFAKYLPEDGEVVTIEKFDHFAEIARNNFKNNGFKDKINLIEGDASDVLNNLPRDKKFDLIFIDGHKELYKEYMVLCEPLLSGNGIMIVDDVFFHGDAINVTPTTAKGDGCRAVIDYSAERNDFLRILLPLANGILLMVKN